MQDVVAEWTVHGTLNVQVMSSNLTAASWLVLHIYMSGTQLG